jgi:RNA polymerase sigma-70 factor (ECF subfamily)
MSDATSAARFEQADEDAVFARLYRSHLRPVRDFCRRRLAADLVDDAVSETFLTAWRRLEDVPDGDAALVWLYRVAYRVVGHHWRSTARRRRLGVRLSSVAPRVAATDDDSVVADEQRRIVLEAARRLGDADAEVLRLFAWERLAIADIAAVLGIAPNAVKQRLHRARRNLAREYRRLESVAVTPIAPQGGPR